MTSFKGLSAAFSASVAIHALAVCALVLPWNQGPPGTSETIQVDFVAQQKTSPAEVSAPRPPAPAPEVRTVPAPAKKAHGIPAQWKTEPKTETPAPPTDFQKLVDEKIRKQLKQLRSLEAAEEEPALPAPGQKVSSAMTSAELLSNPEKGKIFLGYFSDVKRRIQSSVYSKADRLLYGRGSVCLGFVLTAQGKLEKVMVLEKGTHADDIMIEMAKRCLRESAPFGRFPKDLGTDRISFNITIFFDSTP